MIDVVAKPKVRSGRSRVFSFPELLDDWLAPSGDWSDRGEADDLPGILLIVNSLARLCDFYEHQRKQERRRRTDGIVVVKR